MKYMGFGNINGLMSWIMQEDIFPIVAFFGLFVVIYFIGWPIFQRIPHKKDGMLYEMLKEIPIPKSDKTSEDDEGEDIVLNISTDDIVEKEGN